MWGRAADGLTRAVRRIRGPALLAAGAVVLSACAGVQEGALEPKGPAARNHADLFLISFWVSVVVYAVVGGLTLYALFRRRRGDGDDEGFRSTRFVAVGGIAVPSVILLGLMVLTFWFLARVPTEGDMRITVTGHQFWWEVRYDEFDFVTANEIHIPVGVDVEVRLESDDVLHSLWVPELAGKADLVPGRTNELVIRADEPGTFRGQCAEFCGVQHAHMAFLVIAEEPEQFEAWARAQARPAVVDDARGEEIFETHACAGCHTVRGTEADGQLGPDLTHLASRNTLGAGTIPNTRGHLAGWVVNSQTVKPGNEMPPITTLDPEQLQILLDYLEALE